MSGQQKFTHKKTPIKMEVNVCRLVASNMKPHLQLANHLARLAGWSWTLTQVVM
jgi:hypothetical protein